MTDENYEVLRDGICDELKINAIAAGEFIEWCEEEGWWYYGGPLKWQGRDDDGKVIYKSLREVYSLYEQANEN